jgi:hypothetical protein
MLDAMGNVILQNLLLNLQQGGTDSGDLRHNINAVAVFLDHTLQAADLSLDSRQPLCQFGFLIILHVDLIPPLGIPVKLDLNTPSGYQSAKEQDHGDETRWTILLRRRAGSKRGNSN